MTANQRLKEVIDLLHFKTQKDFAKDMDVTPGAISDVIRGRNGIKISTAIKYKLESKYNVNLEWLEKGTGEPFTKKGPAVTEAKEGVPYYDISLLDAQNFIIEEEQAEYLVNFRPFNDCSAYFPVFGDSMYPKYASGEIIAVKEVTNYEVLQWGEAYVVMTDEKSNHLRSIKLLYEHNDKNKLILRSSNPNFKGDTIIDRKSIQSLYLIKGKITRNVI